MIKKITLLILCLCMTLTAFTGYAEEESVTDVSQTQFAEDIELIINLGLAEGYDGIYDIYSNVTRSEFVVLVSNLVNADGFASVKVFKDVEQSDPAFNAIAKLYSKGYIEGDGNGLFRPSDPIKVSEAAKILLSIAGYNRMGENLDDYMKIAAERGLTKGIASKDGYLTNGYAVKMFANALDLNIVEYTTSGGNIKLVINEEETVLSYIARIETVKGQLTATKDVNINGGEPMLDGEILFGEYVLRSYDYDDYLGYFGTCYYKENEWESGEFDVLYIKPDKDNLHVRVEADDFYNYENYRYSYYNENDVEKTLKLSKDTIFIYNSSLAETISDDLIMIDYGYIDFLDSDGDNIYDIVQISEYQNMVVESFSNEVIYSKFDNMPNINIEEYDEINVYNESGKKVNVDSIVSGNVLSVYKNQEGSSAKPKLKLVISTKAVTGTVEKVDRDGNDIYVTIGEETFKVYSDYRAVAKNDIALKDSGTYLLDAENIIVSVTSVVNNQYKPAFLIKVINLDDTNDPSAMQIAIRAYFSDTGYQTVNLDEKKVKIDGADYRKNPGEDDQSYSSILSKLQTCLNQIIMVKTKPDGTINAIDTQTSNTSGYLVDDRLKAGSPLTGARYKSETMVFEGKCAIDEKTVVFVVPADPQNAQPNEFMVSTSAYFGNDTPYDFTPYFLEKDKVSADVILIQGSTTNVGAGSKIGVITGISTSFNEEEGEVVDIFTVNVFGAEEEWMTQSQEVSDNIYKITIGSNSGNDTTELITNPPSLTKGDIIKCSFDESNSISLIALIYDASEETMISPNPSFSDFHPGGYRYALGQVKRKSGNVVELDIDPTIETDAYEYHALGSKPITIIDISEKNISQSGTFSDVHIGDMVFSINRGGNTVCSYVIR